MKKMTTVTIASTILSAALLTQLAFASGVSSVEVLLAPFHWTVNGNEITTGETFNNGTTEVPVSVNYKGTTYLPVRVIAEQLGLSVEWDGQAKKAVLVDATMDDPLGNLPYKSVEYSNWTNLTTTADLIHEPGVNKKVLKVLTKGVKVKVLGEISRSWIKVALENGTVGFLPPTATDYILLADRPAWEQKADSMISLGFKYLSTPYDFGAPLGQTDRFDCSSFVNYVYGLHNIKLKRTSRDQSNAGTEVSFEQARKGDLLFFTTPARKDRTGVQRIGHVAIYLGDNKILHTFRVGIGVTVTELDKDWTNRFIKATRVIN